jgi:hypothetical protein
MYQAIVSVYVPAGTAVPAVAQGLDRLHTHQLRPTWAQVSATVAHSRLADRCWPDWGRCSAAVSQHCLY